MSEERDVSDEIEFKNGRALPGWSQEEIWHMGQHMGWLYCGDPKIRAPFQSRYRIELKPEGENTRCIIWDNQPPFVPEKVEDSLAY